MSDWKAQMKGDPTGWLSEEDNPSVRYLTLRHLLGRPEDDPEVRAARAAIPRSRVVERFFARQATDGFWGDPANPYLPKYKASYWTLMVLGHLGLSREDERVQRAVEHIFRFQQPVGACPERSRGGFAEFGEEEARREYLYKVERARGRDRKLPEESAFVADLVHQMTLSCLTGNVVAALLRLGYGDDPRTWRAVDWLVSIQNADGGWLCPYWKAHIRDTHSCFYGTICPIEAFAEIPEDKRPPAVQEAAARGAEFLLMHRLYRADHHDFQVINPDWLKLAFPWFYGYNILRGLWVLTRLGYRDERMEDALAVLQEKQTPEGKWVLESTPYGRMQTNLEKKGQPSKWITLKALWVLERRLSMTSTHLSQKAETYLRRLCLEIPSRRVGSEGNQAATDFFAGIVASFGFETESPEFDCIDWSYDGVDLTVDGAPFEAFASPYSLGCQVSAPLMVVSTVEELEAAKVSAKIILLRGDIAREQLMPKNFTFYNPDHHKRIVQLLETKKPQAIIAATSRNPELVGAMYPFPLIEDGDFDIPSVYMTEEEGNRLAEHAGKEVSLESRAHRIPAKGCNVIARKGANPQRRVVLFAHIDARIGSPGASDNASGVIVLLLLAELLAGYRGTLDVEIVAMNGEDYYAAPGEQQYLAINAGRFDEIILGINLDDVGYYRGNVAYSLYDCPSDMASSIHPVFSVYEGLVEGEPWYQGDHGLFLMNHRPTLAITSELLTELMTEITHTPQDRPEIVDSTKLVNVAFALRDLLLHLDELSV